MGKTLRFVPLRGTHSGLLCFGNLRLVSLARKFLLHNKKDASLSGKGGGEAPSYVTKIAPLTVSSFLRGMPPRFCFSLSVYVQREERTNVCVCVQWLHCFTGIQGIRRGVINHCGLFLQMVSLLVAGGRGWRIGRKSRNGSPGADPLPPTFM